MKSIHLRAKEGLGYLPQQRSVFNMSVYDNIWELLKFQLKVSTTKSVTKNQMSLICNT